MHQKYNAFWGVPMWLFSMFLILLLGIRVAHAQELRTLQISGLVRDSQGNPMPGVVVTLDETQAKAVTDSEGRYAIALKGSKPPYAITYRYIGMEVLAKRFSRPTNHADVTLKNNANLIDDVVVTGYRTITKHNLAGSVTALTHKDLPSNVPTNIDNMLQGLAAGVVVTNSGEPGSTSKIRIRGINTISGDADPLWIVDGVPLQDDLPRIDNMEVKAGDFHDIFVKGISGINPDDIENITILKDASATAIYGSRAAGGVIVVTTKRGGKGQVKVNYGLHLSSQLKPQRDENLMNASEKIAWEEELWREFAADRMANGSTHVPVVGLVGMVRANKVGREGRLWTDPAFEPMTEDEKNAYLKDIAANTNNWHDMIFRNSLSMRHHLSLSGGSNQMGYYVSLGYASQDGLLRQSGYKRYNLAANLNFDPNKRMKVRLGIKVSRERSDAPASIVNPFTYAYFANPYEIAYTADGSYRPDMTYFNLASINDGDVEAPKLPVGGFNILREMEHTSKKADKTAVSGVLDIRYRLCDPITLSVLVSYSHDNNDSETLIDKDTYTAFKDRMWFDERELNWTPYGSLLQSAAHGDSYTGRVQADFGRRLGAHDIRIFGGAEIRGNRTMRFFAKQYGYDAITHTVTSPKPSNPSKNDATRYASLMEQLTGRNEVDNRFASFYLGADYALRDRYILNTSLRSDGSNNFGSEEQFNPTWSMGAGWHIDREAFMRPFAKVVSRLALRVSGGFTGNVVRGVDKKLVLKLNAWSWNGTPTADIKTAPNPKLRWEKTRDAKVSIDFGLLDNRINGVIEAYYRKSVDVISLTSITSTTGFNAMKYNSSDIVNKGVEATLQVTAIRSRDFSLVCGANIAWNRNILTKYRSTTGGISSGRFLDYPLDSEFAGKLIGLDPYTGVYLFQLRPDAKISSTASLQNTDNYRYYRGTTNAPYNGGLSLRARYRNFGLSVSGMMSFGGLITNLIKSPAVYSSVTYKCNEYPQTQYSDLYSNHLNVRRDMTDRWTADNTTGVKYPRIVDALGERLGLGDYNPTEAVGRGIVTGAFLEKVNYVKVRDITLSYNTPKSVLRKMALNSLDVSITLSNFFTFTNYTGMDPENPGAMYPNTRAVSFGINVGI
ncbi:TonB-dependent receptor plug domain protein [Bacteroidales bacterium KA00344]|nr:TonB-dependent receptor plug domain protein [Bacteroidales bacterium KA00344]